MPEFASTNGLGNLRRYSLKDDLLFSLKWLGGSVLLVPLLAPFAETMAAGNFLSFPDLGSMLVLMLIGIVYIDDFLIVFSLPIFLWPLLTRRLRWIESDGMTLGFTLMLGALPIACLTFFLPGIFQEGRLYPALVKAGRSYFYMAYVLAAKTFFIWLVIYLPRLKIRPPGSGASTSIERRT